MKTMYASLGILFGCSNAALAATTTYSNQGDFQAALTAGFTVIDTSANIGQTTLQLSETYGVEFFGQSSYVRSDGLIPHGAFFDPANPHVGINFADPVNGVGVTSNVGDGGTIMIYDGLDGTGNLLGTASFGSLAPALFGGIISTDLIRSVVFTCEYNFDLACGLIDPTFGKVAVVPVPAALWLFAAGLLGLAGVGRRARVPSA